MGQKEQRQIQAEQSWLSYFNQILRDRNVITEADYRRMQTLIYQRASIRKADKQKAFAKQ